MIVFVLYEFFFKNQFIILLYKLNKDEYVYVELANIYVSTFHLIITPAISLCLTIILKVKAFIF